MSNSRVLAPNSLIAIIAISGYVGSYCGLAALQAGYRVRGTVRSLERGKAVKDAYIKAGVKDIDTRLEIVLLDDLNSKEQYRKAFKGADGAIQTAIDWSDHGKLAILDTLTENTHSVLEAAKLVPTLKRLVYVSTVCAVVLQGSSTFLDKVLTAEDWNEEALTVVQEGVATGRTPHALWLYAAAKTKAEKAAWEFMEREKPHFELVCTLPGGILGPWLVGDPPSSANGVAGLFKGETWSQELEPATWHIDSRDCGKVHIECLLQPSLAGKRVLCINEPHGWNQILAIWRKHFPGVSTIAADLEPRLGDTWNQRIDNALGKELVGGEFIGVERSVVDLGKCLGY